MSLTTALNIAQSALFNTTRQTTVVSNNVANAGNENYARRSAVVVSTAPGLFLASSAIRSSFVETVGELKVSPIVPSFGSNSRRRSLLRRVPSGWFPRFIAPIAALRLLVAPGQASFPSRCPFRLAPETTRSPRLLGSPCMHADVSDPG